MLNHHPRTSIQPFSNLSVLLTIGGCPENVVMISLTVQEFHRQTDRQTRRQTDTAENNTTFAVRLVNNENKISMFKVHTAQCQLEAESAE